MANDFLILDVPAAKMRARHDCGVRREKSEVWSKAMNDNHSWRSDHDKSSEKQRPDHKA